MNQGAKTCEELIAFYKEKIRIEEIYARDMLALSRKAYGMQEFGQMRDNFEVLKQQTNQIAQSHLKQAKIMKNEQLLQLETYLSNYKGRRMPIESSIESLRSAKKSLTDKVLKLKENYRRESAYLKTLLANDGVVLGKQAEKSRERQQKQQRVVDDLRQQFQTMSEQLAELNKSWIDKWKTSSAELEQYEMERVSFIVESLWEYSNNISTNCVNDDLTCENVRQSLEKCDPPREIAYFAKKFATGSEIYSTPRFVDYSNGESDNIGDYEAGESIGAIIEDARKTTSGLSYMNQTQPQSHPHHQPQPQAQARLQSQHTATSHQTQSTTIYRPSQQQQQPMSSFTQQEVTGNHDGQYHVITKNVRKPPPSETGLTAISNPSSASALSDHHSHGMSSEVSGYSSNPTTISDFTASIDEEQKIAKSWNSPMRRKSRMSTSTYNPDKALPAIINVNNINNNSNNNNELFMQSKSDLKHQHRASSYDHEVMKLTNSLRVLSGGHDTKQVHPSGASHTDGSYNRSKSFQDPHNDLMTNMNNFNSSMMSAKSNGTTIRPKSMYDFHQSATYSHPSYPTSTESAAAPNFGQSSSSVKTTTSNTSHSSKLDKRSSFHAGLRSLSRSSLNLQSKISSNGLPIKTSDGRRVIRHAKAQYDFQASIESELSFNKDDILLVINKQEDNWWECERLGSNGQFGLVPYNYVEEI